MTTYLLISGGCERKNGYELGEGKYYESARLLKLNTDTGEFTTVLEKAEGGEHYPDVHPNLQFTSCCVDKEVLWLPTDTEIYKYKYPSMELLKVISYPFFHNIHSVNVFGERVYVSSTGLDLVAVLDTEGNLKKLYNTEGKDLWHRFSENTDYRLIHSTRPHDCHPNFVFEWNNKPWVTRCRQQDSVCLDNVSDVIPITDQKKRISVHDGIFYKDRVIFTTVDGFLVLVNPETREIEEEINVLEGFNGEKLGWARGVCVDGDMVYLGFSRLRRTRMKEKLAWLAKGQVTKMNGMPACVIAYHMGNREVKKKFDVPIGMIDAIYGVELVR